MTVIKKVLANNAQTLSSAEQARARFNIDASKVVIASAPTVTGAESVSGTILERDLAIITSTYKSLLIISVYTSVTLNDTSTPADLLMSIDAPPAIKLGMSDGENSLANTSCSYGVSSGTVLRKFSSFCAVLEANQALTIKGAFQSTVAGFQVSYSVNYTQLALE